MKKKNRKVPETTTDDIESESSRGVIIIKHPGRKGFGDAWKIWKLGNRHVSDDRLSDGTENVKSQYDRGFRLGTTFIWVALAGALVGATFGGEAGLAAAPAKRVFDSYYDAYGSAIVRKLTQFKNAAPESSKADDISDKQSSLQNDVGNITSGVRAIASNNEEQKYLDKADAYSKKYSVEDGVKAYNDYNRALFARVDDEKAKAALDPVYVAKQMALANHVAAMAEELKGQQFDEAIQDTLNKITKTVDRLNELEEEGKLTKENIGNLDNNNLEKIEVEGEELDNPVYLLNQVIEAVQSPTVEPTVDNWSDEWFADGDANAKSGLEAILLKNGTVGANITGVVRSDEAMVEGMKAYNSADQTLTVLFRTSDADRFVKVVLTGVEKREYTADELVKLIKNRTIGVKESKLYKAVYVHSDDGDHTIYVSWKTKNVTDQQTGAKSSKTSGDAFIDTFSGQGIVYNNVSAAANANGAEVLAERAAREAGLTYGDSQYVAVASGDIEGPEA